MVRSNEQYGAATLLGYLVGFTEQDRPYTGLSLTHGNAQLMTLGQALGNRVVGGLTRIGSCRSETGDHGSNIDKLPGNTGLQSII